MPHCIIESLGNVPGVLEGVVRRHDAVLLKFVVLIWRQPRHTSAARHFERRILRRSAVVLEPEKPQMH